LAALPGGASVLACTGGRRLGGSALNWTIVDRALINTCW
jgi:hypothetical protein